MITPLTTPSVAAIHGESHPALNFANAISAAPALPNIRYVTTSPPITVIAAAAHVEILRSL